MVGKDRQEELSCVTQFLQGHSEIVSRLGVEKSEVGTLLERLAMQPFEHPDRQRRGRLRQSSQRLGRNLRSPTATLEPTPQRQLKPRVARIHQRLAQLGVARSAVRF